MYELALFAGAGGGLLGSRLLGWRTVCYVERDAYCVEVLKARMRDGCLDDAPIWDDVRTFDGRPWAGCVDVVSAGFPCQPWSSAGKRLGESDERNLWPDTVRVIREVRPEWVLLENVPGLLSKPYIRRIFADLAEGGYDCEWDCLSAADVGAPHLRKRLWIVAHARGEYGGLRLQSREDRPEAADGCDDVDADFEQYESNSSQNGRPPAALLSANPNGQRCKTEIQHIIGFEQCTPKSGSHGEIQFMADADHAKTPRQRGNGGEIPAVAKAEGFDVGSGALSDANSGDGTKHSDKRASEGDILVRSNPGGSNPGAITWWATESGLGRMADGVAHRLDRLRAIGNGQVPAVARAAWRLLT